MRCNRIYATALTLIFIHIQPSFADTNIDVLEKARRLVEKKSYTEALKLYNQISGWLEKDAGLLIEWARVYAYADNYRQAIALFEEIRKRYPEKEKEILLELADQYKWDGQIKKSIEVYRKALNLQPENLQVKLGLAQALSWDNLYKEAIDYYDLILKNTPDSMDALLGKAEVFSWLDKLEEANRLYAKVLKKEPQNLSALNGQARNNVWQGYHRKGIRLYQQILKRNPDNPDSLEGLAFAYHCNGQDYLALKLLEELLSRYPQRNTAKELYNEINNLRSLHFNQFNRYSYDSNRLYMLSDNLHVGKYIDTKTGIGATYNWYLYKQPLHPSLNAEREGLDFYRHFNEYLEANSFFYLTKYDAKGFTPFTTNTWFTLRPHDIWRFDISYDRETFEDITALHNEIIVNSGSFSFDLRPNRFWFFSAKYKRGKYSDDNYQDTAFLKVEFRIKHKPYLKLFYNYYFSDWSELKDNGYFNPHSIQSQVIGIYASKDLSKNLFLEGQISSGYETQNPKSDHPTYLGALGINYRLSPNWLVTLRSEYFNALDTNPKKEYSKKTVWLNLTYRFGVEPTRPYQATQPQRPTGR